MKLTRLAPRQLIFIFLTVFVLPTLYADVSLPKIFADDMVLQRHEPINIWGWAKPDEKILVSLGGSIKQTKADKSGHWSVMLPALKAKKNLTLTIHGNNKLQFTKVAIGEVWLASGQSNMAFKMGQVKSMFPEEMIIDNALDIRQFYIDTDYNYKTPQSDFDKATWQLTNHKTIKDFSAVAWFFAKEIAQKQGVTVGILNASVGNTQVQSWRFCRKYQFMIVSPLFEINK